MNTSLNATSALWPTEAANPGVVIPYNAPPAAPSADFEQVLNSVTPAQSGAASGTATSRQPDTTIQPGSSGVPGGVSPVLPGMGTGTPPVAGAAVPPASSWGIALPGGMPSMAAPQPFTSGSASSQPMPGAACCCSCGAMPSAAAPMSMTMPVSNAPGGIGGGSATREAGSAAMPPAALELPFQGQVSETQPFGPTSYAAEPAYDGYAHFHTGIDFGMPLGTPIAAAAPGRVVAAGWDTSGFGIRVLIDHGNGVRTLYGHLESTTVSPGDFVQAGQQIGLSGSTGNSSGPHLHFGVEQNDRWVNPAPYLALGSSQASQMMAQPATTSTASAAAYPMLAGAVSGSTGAMPVDGAAPAGTTSGALDGAVATDGEAANLGSLIQQVAQQTGVPASLLGGVVRAESGGNPLAVSPAGAKGLMQLMDSTAAAYGVGNVFDPQQNLMGGAQYLHSLLQRYNGNEQLALAAYNAGPGAVDRYGGIPPYPETQQYVQRIMTYLRS